MGLTQDFEKFIKDIGNKTNEIIDVTKLKNKISKEKSEVKKNYEKIGEYYYNKYLNDGFDDVGVNTYFGKIDDSKHEIHDLENKIRQAKSNTDKK